MKTTALPVLLGTIFLVGGCGQGLVSPPLTHNTTGSTLPTSTTGGHASSSTSSTSGGVNGSMDTTTTTGGRSSTGDSTSGTGTTSGTTGGSRDSTSTSSSTGGLTCSNCSSDQVCDSHTGRCVHCASDSDCSGATPICQSSTDYLRYGECVQCSEGEPTCPSPQVCDLSLGRTYHQCVADCRLVTTTPACPSDEGFPTHCAQATGTCVGGCVTAADCAPGSLLCNVDAGSCVECLSAADCPYSNPGCSYHRCGYCDDDTNCPAGLACSPSSAFQGHCGCPDGGGCGGNAPVCNNSNYYYEVCGCLTNDDCASQQAICNVNAGFLGAGVCIPPCNDGGVDCSQTNQYCDLDAGLCGPCGFDDQCVGNDAGPHCLFNGACGCNVNADCGSGNVCDNIQCRASCAIDGGTDCTTMGYRQFCDLGTGLCAPCSANTQCIGNDAGPVCLTSGACGCQSASDCGLNGACDNNSRCQLSCTLDGGPDCSSSNLVCDPDSRVCVDCIDDTQCSAPTPACTADIHQGNSCVQCVLPSQCPDSNPGCNSLYNQCGWCHADVDCPTSLPICNPNLSQCVSSCLLSDGGTFCATGGCDTTSGYCVPCVQDSNCQQDGFPYCAMDIDAGEFCVECITPDQCPDSTPGCNTEYFSCGWCYTDSECPSNKPMCSGGQRCVTPCDGGTTCPTGACSTDLGYCVDCVQDSDCTQPGLGYCINDLGYGNYCVQCVASSDCGDAGPCNSGYFQCGSCYYDTDCPPEVPSCSYNYSTGATYCSDGGF